MPQLTSHEIVMPRLTDSMEEGTVLKWLKRVGDDVQKGEPVVEIETDKAAMTFESDGSGTLTEILVQEGETAPIGTAIARLGEPGAPATAAGPVAASQGEPAPHEVIDRAKPAATPSPAPVVAAAPQNGDGRVKASPLARRIAAAAGVDLAGIPGSGPGGRIVKRDVESAAQAGVAPEPEAPAAPAAAQDEPAAASASPAPVETSKGAAQVVELSRLQRTVARRMAESKATIPDFQVSADIDMTEAVALRARLKELAGEGAPAPSYNDIVIRACALALRDLPRVNSSYEDGAVRLHSRINVGMAVAAEGSLVVPTIFDADQKSLGEIARVSRTLAQKVRDGSVTPPELAGGTFTVSNLGMFGVDSFIPVINPPQVAIIAIGRMAQRPVVDRSGRVVARHAITATLSADHRVLYGADAAEFLGRVRSYLEQPLSIAL